jgi:hypothetical protein
VRGTHYNKRFCNPVVSAAPIRVRSGGDKEFSRSKSRLIIKKLGGYNKMEGNERIVLTEVYVGNVVKNS